MKKLLVTGASGFLGWNLCQVARKYWQVYGTYFSHLVEIPGVSLTEIDLRDYSSLQQLFVATAPDAVIHTAAASKPNFCQTHPLESYSINVEASLNVARLCAKFNIPCAFTSTDLVFDGKSSFYKESDPVSPISYYGEQKVAAEQKMLAIHPQIAVCRMPLMFGLASPVAGSMLQPMVTNLKAGTELNLFVDEFRTPASATTAAKGLLLAIEKRVTGILHLGGKERISRYDFGLLLANILNLPASLIKPGKQEDVTMAAPRSPDTSLDSSKAFVLGYQPLSLREELLNLVEHL
ncbi:NAD(P)-dependent oxidoreductase [Myxosarcina sp. GI1]|uniref:SDR family oxidoreductase n=1 Tax=Myxosarcina sp. GI1 TaxID=1541065 RepID=UPI00055B86FD|nr:NAD(P)-dependent oxidoreductase [Myxosarcina sp. GI1]